MQRVGFFAFAVVLGALQLGLVAAQESTPRVGILTIIDTQNWYEPIYRTLREQGWVEGRTVSFEYRTPQDRARYAPLAEELVRAKVNVILAIGPTAVRETVAATKTTPIVAHDLENDPVSLGYLASYARPGGNVTGVFLDAPELAGKWFQSLTAVIPRLSRLLVLWDPTSGPVQVDAIRAAAKSHGVQLEIRKVTQPADIPHALSTGRHRHKHCLFFHPR